jgi:SagB-type dehydrogenase family enzyme
VGELLTLPAPRDSGTVAVEAVLKSRRSVREFRGGELTMAEVSQLLWAAQGITDTNGFRTAPSAGALYPLEIFLSVGDVSGLAPGTYRYGPDNHALAPIVEGERRRQLADAALVQSWIADAAVVLVIAVVASRTMAKYGRRGIRYVHMEVGHAAQNLYLQATALGLGTTVVGAFDDTRVAAVVGMSGREKPLALLPVGRL